MTSTISFVNDALEPLTLHTTVSPSLSSDDWGIHTNDVPANSVTTDVVWFNRDEGIHDGDTWVFRTTFTYDGIAWETEEELKGTALSSDMSQRMLVNGKPTEWGSDLGTYSLVFVGQSGASWALTWDRYLDGAYDSVKYTLSRTSPVTPSYKPVTAVMPQIETVVYLMLENRSLDNVLGWLYQDRSRTKEKPKVCVPGDPPFDFDGIPSGAHNKVGDTTYEPVYGTGIFGTENRVPAFDPHEPMHHVKYQMYASSDGTMPSGDYWAKTPPMTGFAWDYSATYDDPDEVMGAFDEADLPVLYGLAKAYGISDRWFASVPTQTDPNRAFSVCGTSLGAEANDEIDESTYANALTIFNALGANGKSWGMYYQSENPFGTGEPILSWKPFTSYYFPQLKNAPNGKVDTFDEFKKLATEGSLPNFCFLEPFWGGGKGEVTANSFIGIQGNDYHPPSWPGPAEYDLNALFELLVSCPQWDKMLFIISFDEHGGTYDHVAPPTAPAPDGRTSPYEFAFERLGVRVPTILVSPYVAEGTVFRPTNSASGFDHTSFIATMLKWAGVDPSSAGLGSRVAVAPTFEAAVTTTKRTDAPTFTVPSSYQNQGGGTGALLGINVTSTMDIKQYRGALERASTPDELREEVRRLPDVSDRPDRFETAADGPDLERRARPDDAAPPSQTLLQRVKAIIDRIRSRLGRG